MKSHAHCGYHRWDGRVVSQLSKGERESALKCYFEAISQRITDLSAQVPPGAAERSVLLFLVPPTEPINTKEIPLRVMPAKEIATLKLHADYVKTAETHDCEKTICVLGILSGSETDSRDYAAGMACLPRAGPVGQERFRKEYVKKQ